MKPFLNKWGQFLIGLTVRLPQALHRRRAPDAVSKVTDTVGRDEGLRTVVEQIARNQAELVKQLESLTLAIASLERAISKQGEDLPGFRLDRAGNIVPLRKRPPRADKTVVCLDCGSEFVCTAVEQVLFHYIHEPQRCRRCRTKFVPPPPEDDWGTLTGNGHPT